MEGAEYTQSPEQKAYTEEVREKWYQYLLDNDDDDFKNYIYTKDDIALVIKEEKNNKPEDPNYHKIISIYYSRKEINGRKYGSIYRIGCSQNFDRFATLIFPELNKEYRRFIIIY